MRVTNEMIVANSMNRLHDRLGRYERVQSQMALGKRMLAPSDDAGATARAMSLRASIRSREQEARNADDARSWLDLADSQLQTAVSRLQRARDLVTRGATEINEPEARALAAELRTIVEELVGVANFRHTGRPLFAGTSADSPVEVTAGPPPTYAFTGDGLPITRRVGDHDVVQVNVDGAQAFGFADGDDVFGMLSELADAIEAGDKAAVTGGLTRIDDARGRLTDALATVGSATNWVDSAQARADESLFSLKLELSQIEDVDIAEAVMNLQLEQVAYEATLQALSRALPPSLASFLR